MKLATPSPTYRFVLNPHDMTVVVGGVFPPEDAPSHRTSAARMIPLVEPGARAAWETSLRRWEHELLYGRDDAREPVGIMRGVFDR